jgi:uncharacterized protein YegP (UPF0339 family)
MKLVGFHSDKDSQFYVRLVGGNNENLMSSEGHHNEDDVDELIESIVEAFTTGNFKIVKEV